MIFVFSYYRDVDTSFEVITKDVRIGLKFQARDTHIIGNTSDGGTFDFHAKALNPSHQNDKTVILSKPLGKISFSSDQSLVFSSDFACFIFDKNIFLGAMSMSTSTSMSTVTSAIQDVVDVNVTMSMSTSTLMSLSLIHI